MSSVDNLEHYITTNIPRRVYSENKNKNHKIIVIVFVTILGIWYLYVLYNCCFYKIRCVSRVNPIIQEEIYIPPSESIIESKQIKLKDIKRAPNHMVCVICLDELISSDTLIQLNCEHIFHQDCILEWYYTEINKSSNTCKCPLCRAFLV